MGGRNWNTAQAEDESMSRMLEPNEMLTVNRSLLLLTVYTISGSCQAGYGGQRLLALEANVIHHMTPDSS